MLEQVRRVLVGSEIGSGVSTPDLPQRIVDITVEINAKAHLAHQVEVARRLDDAAAARHEQTALDGKRGQHLGLKHAEGILTIDLKDIVGYVINGCDISYLICLSLAHGKTCGEQHGAGDALDVGTLEDCAILRK